MSASGIPRRKRESIWGRDCKNKSCLGEIPLWRKKNLTADCSDSPARFPPAGCTQSTQNSERRSLSGHCPAQVPPSPQPPGSSSSPFPGSRQPGVPVPASTRVPLMPLLYWAQVLHTHTGFPDVPRLRVPAAKETNATAHPSNPTQGPKEWGSAHRGCRQPTWKIRPQGLSQGAI